MQDPRKQKKGFDPAAFQAAAKAGQQILHILGTGHRVCQLLHGAVGAPRLRLGRRLCTGRGRRTGRTFLHAVA